MLNVKATRVERAGELDECNLEIASKQMITTLPKKMIKGCFKVTTPCHS